MDAKKFIESKGLKEDQIVESDYEEDEYFQYRLYELLEEYHQAMLKNNVVLDDALCKSKQLKAFTEFCHDNYSMVIPDRIIKEYEQSI